MAAPTRYLPQERPTVTAGPLLGRWPLSDARELAGLRTRAAAAAVIDEQDRAAAQLLVLAVSELVANGLKYGSPPLVLRLYRTDEGWLVDVRDGNSDEPPVLRSPGLERLGGHGLRIVSQTSTAWGWYREHTDAPHKHVWAHIPAVPAA